MLEDMESLAEDTHNIMDDVQQRLLGDRIKLKSSLAKVDQIGKLAGWMKARKGKD